MLGLGWRGIAFAELSVLLVVLALVAVVQFRLLGRQTSWD